MTTPFVAQLRARPGIVRLGGPGDAVISIRVEVPEVWDTVRVDAPPETPVEDVKRRALDVLLSDGADPARYVVKLRGWEVLDESRALADVGALDGSTLLVTNRRRRPVR
jgi:hypothetical protein